MKTFKQLMQLLEHDVDEALTNAQRLKAKLNFRKNKNKIALGRERAKNKLANADTLNKRAKGRAQREVEKKLLGGKSKQDLSFAQRSSLEKKVKKKAGAIAKGQKKLLKVVRAADRK